MKLFSKKNKKFIAEFEKSSTFASLFTKQSAGVVVQLVRIPAWLEYRPVTPGVEGSSPFHTAEKTD